MLATLFLCIHPKLASRTLCNTRQGAGERNWRPPSSPPRTPLTLFW
uniref:Uncharacterized protein MANES_04G152300 n=1 Tax=Rhizophora mucronata TaxID=61149 RepID=A0A2P2JAS2_RHIMU